MKNIIFVISLLQILICKPNLTTSKNLSTRKFSATENNPSLENYRIYPGNTTQVQTSIAVHPTNPLIMAASAITDVYPGGYTTGAYVTTNGGSNWSGTNSIYDNLYNIITTLGDPTITINKNGMIILAYTSRPTGATDNKVGVSYSSNNGIFWSPPVFVPGVGRSDKVSSISDNSPLSPYYGKAYLVYSDFLKSGLYFSASTNGGLNWDTVKRVSLPFNDARVGASIALGKYGEIYVSWPFHDVPTQKSYIGFAKSTNGGANWTSSDYAIPVNLSSLAFRLFINSCRLNGIPTLSVDNSGGPRDGTIYITCIEKAAEGSPATDGYDVLIRSSADFGASWNNSVKVNQDNSGSLKYQFFPVVNVDKHGGVNVIYYDSRSTVTNDSFEVYMARSVDGGIHFEDYLISDHKFKLKPITPTLFGIPGYIGSYIGVTSSANTITPVWFDNSTQIFQAWSSKIKLGLAIKIIPQGFYNLTTDKLRMKDTVKAYLRNSYLPYTIVDSASGILDSVSFISEMIFKNANSGNYYLQVKHRNSLDVWSSEMISYSTGKQSLYDFTLLQAQTYGDNSVIVEDKWCSYSGDIDNDGSISMEDTGIIYNDVSSFTNGYSKSDVNGDGAVDLVDLNIAFNNSINFIHSITP